MERSGMLSPTSCKQSTVSKLSKETKTS